MPADHNMSGFTLLSHLINEHGQSLVLVKSMTESEREARHTALHGA